MSLDVIERDLMAAEYLLDSTLTHVRRKHCEDVKPISLRRLQRSLERVRVARERLRKFQGHRQWTLFAGSSRGGQNRKQKPWSHHTAHQWKKDCDP